MQYPVAGHLPHVKNSEVLQPVRQRRLQGFDKLSVKASTAAP